MGNKILLVAATQFEIQPLLTYYSYEGEIRVGNPILLNENIALLLTGVGMVSTSFYLGRVLSNFKYDILLNVGIAGSFTKRIKLGEVVFIEEDVLSELGAQNDTSFISASELNLVSDSDIDFRMKKTKMFDDYRAVRSITVNCVHGNDESIQRVIKRLNPTIETMEGAAFHFACKNMEIRGFQLRAISNYVEKRNREKWNIKLAVKNLNIELLRILNEM